MLLEPAAELAGFSGPDFGRDDLSLVFSKNGELFELTRDNGAEFTVDCTTRFLAFKVQAIRHTKVPRGGSKRTLSEVEGGGYVTRDQFSLKFDSRSHQSRKRESFEATIAGTKR